MSEWWTYRLADFLMFSPRVYWRLVELYNRELWPAHLVAVAVGAGLLLLAALRPVAAARIVPAALAIAWLWVGWAFHWQRYATINWGATAFAIAFWFEAGLQAASAAAGPSNVASRTGALRALGWTLAACGVLLYPLAGTAAGRPLVQAEVFGMMPEPTALATVGLLLAARPRHTLWLLAVPVSSLLVGAATLWLLSA